jgi:hypothetical protein
MKLVRTFVPAALLALTGCEEDPAAPAPDDAATSADVATDAEGPSEGDATAAPDVTEADTAEPPASCPEPTGERPRARAEHAGIVDPARRTLVTFGGSFGVPQNCSAIVNHTYEADTWIFDLACSQWRSVAGGEAPAGRTRHGAVHDSREDRMLIYGGRSRVGGSGPYTLYGDVHAFDLKTETWSRLATTGAPAPRFNAATAYDSVNHRLLVFGGNTSTSGLVYEETNDVWALDLATLVWTKIVATGDAPTPRFWVNGAFDATRSWFVIYGGTNGREAFSDTATYEDDLWALDLSASPPDWYQLNTGAPNPEGRFWAGIVIDADRDRYLMFGGHDDKSLGNRNDLWAFDVEAQTWAAIREGDAYNSPPTGFCQFPPDFATIDSDSPERRHAHVFAAGAGLAVASGGKTDCGSVDDVYGLELDSDRWVELLPATVGEACLRKGGTSCNDMCF